MAMITRKKALTYLLTLCLCFTTLSLAACSPEGLEEDGLPANYGDYGRSKAISLASDFPERYAGSDQEKAAADWISRELEDLGYQVEKQEFSGQTAGGEGFNSQNILVRIEGLGFKEAEPEPDRQAEAAEAGSVIKLKLADISKKRLVMAAHYDTPYKDRQVETQEGAQGDGIHNNAAGVASLLTLAKSLKNKKPGYPVDLVFLGASAADFAGARAYLDNLPKDDIANIDAMYNLDKIYAGDKVYAHAGINSTRDPDSKNYELRQKLYELTDVYYNNMLLTNNGFALYTNQNTFMVQSPISGQEVVFREWTTHRGDHSPFDELDIPIVFIESFEYDVDKYEDLGKETTDPHFSIVDGIVDRSNLDSSSVLNSYFQAAESKKAEKVFGGDSNRAEDGDASETKTGQAAQDNKQLDRLARRINNIAFLLLESSRNAGSDYDLKE